MLKNLLICATEFNADVSWQYRQMCELDLEFVAVHLLLRTLDKAPKILPKEMLQADKRA